MDSIKSVAGHADVPMLPLFCHLEDLASTFPLGEKQAGFSIKKLAYLIRAHLSRLDHTEIFVETNSNFMSTGTV